MSYMRKRGLIILISTLPLWVAAVLLWRQFLIEWKIWYPNYPPLDLFFRGTATWAAIIATIAGLCVLIFDLASWIRGQHDRNNQAS
jgi:uncharacterized membrane protein YhaH (DUF805 family)